MAKRKPKLTPEECITMASYHEQAYRAGRYFAIQMLETIDGLKRARAGIFDGVDRSRFQPDMYFVRGFIESTGPLFSDSRLLMRSDFGLALREAIMDDFFDNSAAALRKAKETPFDGVPRY